MTSDEIYKLLLKVISSERFLKMQGLNNEIPFYICPYHCKDTKAIYKNADSLTRNLEQKGISILTINLYDLCLGMLAERSVLDKLISKETSLQKKQLMELLVNVLDPEKYLAPRIAEIIDAKAYDVLFITGVGEVYPYIRTHNILNNLHSIIKDHPAVIFFPGDYIQTNTGGSTLSLFSRLRTDKYYRAFNILNCVD